MSMKEKLRVGGGYLGILGILCMLFSLEGVAIGILLVSLVLVLASLKGEYE